MRYAVVFCLVCLLLGVIVSTGCLDSFSFNEEVRCTGGTCITPLKGEPLCNTSTECIKNAKTRIAVHYYKDGIQYLNRALVFSPGNTTALVLLGIAKGQSGDPAGALAALDRAVAINPELSVAWQNRGIVQALAGNLTASRQDLEIAVTKPGNSSLAWYNLGLARHLVGIESGAVDAYSHALVIDQNCQPCAVMKAQSLVALGQSDTALSIYTTLNTPEGNRGRGVALADLGRYQESCQAFDSAIDAYSFETADIWSRVCNSTTGTCETLRTDGKPQTADDREFNNRVLVAYDDKLKNSPNDPELWIRRGEILSELGRYDKAVLAFSQSLTLKPVNAEAQNGKGVALFFGGKNTQALDAFLSASSADPMSVKPWNNRAFVLVREGKYTEASKDYAEAVYRFHKRADPKGTGGFIVDTVV